MTGERVTGLYLGLQGGRENCASGTLQASALLGGADGHARGLAGLLMAQPGRRRPPLVLDGSECSLKSWGVLLWNRSCRSTFFFRWESTGPGDEVREVRLPTDSPRSGGSAVLPLCWEMHRRKKNVHCSFNSALFIAAHGPGFVTVVGKVTSSQGCPHREDTRVSAFSPRDVPCPGEFVHPCKDV